MVASISMSTANEPCFNYILTSLPGPLSRSNSSDGTDLSRGMAQPTTGIKVPIPVITNTIIARCQSDTPFCNKHNYAKS